MYDLIQFLFHFSLISIGFKTFITFTIGFFFPTAQIAMIIIPFYCVEEIGAGNLALCKEGFVVWWRYRRWLLRDSWTWGGRNLWYQKEDVLYRCHLPFGFPSLGYFIPQRHTSTYQHHPIGIYHRRWSVEDTSDATLWSSYGSMDMRYIPSNPPS